MPDDPSVLSEAQRALLRLIWDSFRQRGWPTFAQLDRQADGRLDEPLEALLASFQPGWVRFDPHASPRSEVAAWVRALSALRAGDIDMDLVLFVELVRFCVDAERDLSQMIRTLTPTQ